MIAEYRTIAFSTRVNDHIVDLTAEVRSAVASAGTADLRLP
jgi:hypothetical protein